MGIIMTITTVVTLSQLASTTVAAYGNLLLTNDLKTQLVDPEGNANFTDAQATDFVARYSLVNQRPNVSFNGFSATVFEDKVTSKHIIAMRGTEMNAAGQILLDGLVTDGLSIAGN
jgi:hypothetical protein